MEGSADRRPAPGGQAWCHQGGQRSSENRGANVSDAGSPQLPPGQGRARRGAPPRPGGRLGVMHPEQDVDTFASAVDAAASGDLQSITSTATERAGRRVDYFCGQID